MSCTVRCKLLSHEVNFHEAEARCHKAEDEARYYDAEAKAE